MITPGPGVRVYLSTQPCDMRKGMDGLAAQVQNVLAADPFSGALFVFRGKRGDILKICLGRKRLVPVRQAAGAGQVRLAPDRGGATAADAGSTGLARGRHRLAPDDRAGAGPASGGRLIID